MEGVKKVASVLVDLSVVPKDEWNVHQSPSNGTYHSLSLSLKLAIQSSMTFTLHVNGICYGTVKAAYE